MIFFMLIVLDMLRKYKSIMLQMFNLNYKDPTSTGPDCIVHFGILLSCQLLTSLSSRFASRKMCWSSLFSSTDVVILSLLMEGLH